MDIKKNLALFVLTASVWLLAAANAAVNGTTAPIHKQARFESCTDNTFCQLNGLCYQSVNDNHLKFCSCTGKHYGVTCQNNADTLMETIVYALAGVCGLFLILLLVVTLKCFRYKGELKECQQQESWSIGKVMTKPASPMYTQHTFVEIDKKASITSNGNLSNGPATIANGNAGLDCKFDMTDHGLNNDANTFQPINEEDKQSEISESKKGEKAPDISETQSRDDNDEKTRKSSIDYELAQDFLNQQENISTYSESESVNHLIPRHPRGEHSQDGSDIEQNMDHIYRDYYAARAAFEYTNGVGSRAISPSHGRVIPPYSGRTGPVSPRYGAGGHRSPYDRRGDISPNGFMSPYGYDRPISPSSQTSSRPGSRPISPVSLDVRLHPSRGGHPGYATNYRNLKKPRSPRQPGQLGKRFDYTDSNGRPRSMGDLQMIAYGPDYRRNRARSVDNLDTISHASSVENIHTGKVTRVVPRKNGAAPPKGKGIWARTAADY